MHYSAGVKVLQRLECLSDEERHLLLHQLIVGNEVVKQTTVLQPDSHKYSNVFQLLSYAG